MDRRDGVPRGLVIPAVLDINRQGLAVARDLAHRPELLASVGDERLETDLDLFVHGTTPRPQEWATKPRSASAGTWSDCLDGDPLSRRGWRWPGTPSPR